MEIWAPQKQLMILSWIGQKILGVEDVIKLRTFGPQVELSGHQAQILEPRDKGMCVVWYGLVWCGVCCGVCVVCGTVWCVYGVVSGRVQV